MATLVERTSRLTLLVKLPGNDTTRVVNAITNKIIELPSQLKKSLSWDRGMELAKQKKFTIDTEIKVYCIGSMGRKGNCWDNGAPRMACH